MCNRTISWFIIAITRNNHIKCVLVLLLPEVSKMNSLIAQGDCEVKVERFQVICPAYGQQVEAVARDGRVKGYCALAKQSVDFLIETQRTVETKAEMLAGPTPMRDSRGRFVKGNMPLNKKEQSQ
jgi:hypothetical protein